MKNIFWFDEELIFFLFLSEIDSAMFLLTGGSRTTSLSTLRSEGRSNDILSTLNALGNGSSSNLSKIIDAPIKPGNVIAHESLINLLDCCILYYYAVAHKYIIMARISHSLKLRNQNLKNSSFFF